MHDEHIEILSEKIKDKIRKYRGKINQSGMEESVIQTMKAYFEKRNLEIVERKQNQ
jgi:hypothetical protein